MIRVLQTPTVSSTVSKGSMEILVSVLVRYGTAVE
jgi:hypothetical protein